MQSLLGLDAANYRAERNASAAFDLLRRNAEDAGIFVLLKGDLGNYVTALETSVFRGFSIADEVAPFIVDQRPGRQTSLVVHPIARMHARSYRDQRKQCGEQDRAVLQRRCREFLLPAKELKRLALDDCDEIGAIAERISAWANEFKVSSAMVAYKSYRSALITRETYSQLNAIYRKAWQGERERSRAQAREQEPRIRYYTVRRHRLGNRIIGLMERMMAADALSTSKAAQILGVKPRQVQPLLDTGRSR